jgi:hypothetical protein
MLAGAANRAHASGASLHLVCSRTDIRRLFELTGLGRRIPLARTLDEALAALTPPARNNRAARRPHREPSSTAAGRGRPPALRPAPAPSRGDRHDRPA